MLGASRTKWMLGQTVTWTQPARSHAVLAPLLWTVQLLQPLGALTQPPLWLASSPAITYRSKTPPSQGPVHVHVSLEIIASVHIAIAGKR